MKQYGKDKTELSLSQKAQDFYSTCEPLRIHECVNPYGEYVYEITGCFEKRGLTEDELNEFLEELSDTMDI